MNPFQESYSHRIWMFTHIKHHYLLISTIKHFVLVVLSVQCRSRIEERFLDSQNFRARLESARKILREQVMSSGDVQLVEQINQLLEFCNKISKSAAAARLISSSTLTNGQPNSGNFPCKHDLPALLTTQPTADAGAVAGAAATAEEAGTAFPMVAAATAAASGSLTAPAAPSCCCVLMEAFSSRGSSLGLTPAITITKWSHASINSQRLLAAPCRAEVVHASELPVRRPTAAGLTHWQAVGKWVPGPSLRDSWRAGLPTGQVGPGSGPTGWRSLAD